jgi:hypothetical protein
MLVPSQLTIGDIVSSVKDVSILGTLVAIVWKARGVFEAVANFGERVTRHMTAMENFAKTITDNHFTAIESELKILTERLNKVG